MVLLFKAEVGETEEERRNADRIGKKAANDGTRVGWRQREKQEKKDEARRRRQ